MYKNKLILFLVLTICSPLIADYPEPTGQFVSDFAKIIPADMASRLNETLASFEKQTSIEIAVVTTPSLDGLTVEEWTMGLAEEWKVGKKGKDNGLILLVAPNERKMRIEVGYGLEGDLPDGKCGRIRDNYALPNFRKGDYAKGIEEMTQAIIAELGTKTLAERAEAKAEAEAKAAEARKKAEAEIAQFMKIMGIVLLIAVPIIILIVVLANAYNRREEEKRQIQEMHQELNDNLNKLPKVILGLQKDTPLYRSIMEEMQQAYPKENWMGLPAKLLLVAGMITAAESLLASARARNTSEKKELMGAHSESIHAKEKLSKAREIFIAIKDRKEEIEGARDGYKNKLKLAETKVKEAKERAGKDDAGREMRKKAKEAEETLGKAKDHRNGSELTDWLMLALLLSNAIALAEQARKPVREYVSSRRRSNDDDDSSSSYSSRSSSSYHSDSSSSSSSISFGGGGFGGGGASGSW